MIKKILMAVVSMLLITGCSVPTSWVAPQSVEESEKTSEIVNKVEKSGQVENNESNKQVSEKDETSSEEPTITKGYDFNAGVETIEEYFSEENVQEIISQNAASPESVEKLNNIRDELVEEINQDRASGGSWRTRLYDAYMELSPEQKNDSEFLKKFVKSQIDDLSFLEKAEATKEVLKYSDDIWGLINTLPSQN